METSSFDSPGAPPPPPPVAPPPPIITPPPAPRPRKSRGWMIFAIILLVALLFSLLINFTQFVAHAFSFNHNFTSGIAREVGPRLEECLLKDNDARNKIAVVRVDGIITARDLDQSGNNMVDVIKAQLKRAKADDRVKAVILKVDSPGGEVMASDEINKALTKFQADEPGVSGDPVKRGKPVICSMGSLAASGGYYISAPCRWIVADKLTLTASIGVIMETVNYRGPSRRSRKPASSSFAADARRSRFSRRLCSSASSACRELIKAACSARSAPSRLSSSRHVGIRSATRLISESSCCNMCPEVIACFSASRFSPSSRSSREHVPTPPGGHGARLSEDPWFPRYR